MSRYATGPAPDFGRLATIASNRVTEQRDTVTIDDLGDGQPYLLLQGRGGPNTVASFAEGSRAPNELDPSTPSSPLWRYSTPSGTAHRLTIG
jgi:hypothetical protein